MPGGVSLVGTVDGDRCSPDTKLRLAAGWFVWVVNGILPLFREGFKGELPAPFPGCQCSSIHRIRSLIKKTLFLPTL